jgi:hypothetical protein
MFSFNTKNRFNILIIAQRGRWAFEAVMFLASFRASNPFFRGRVFVAIPQPGPKWTNDPRVQNSDTMKLLKTLGAEILPFENRYFGESYPHGNKIEALLAMPKGQPFMFFDTDTLILDRLNTIPIDFSRPSASLKRTNTWPVIELYGPGYTQTWRSLYEKFDLDFESSLDLNQPDEFWKRYLYFNAGFFYYKCPHVFGHRFINYAMEIRDNPPKELICQPMYPWLDQIALPLVIHSLGGGRDALAPGYIDGSHSCHYRALPLLYACQSQSVIDVLETVTARPKIKKVLKRHKPALRLIYQGEGQKARALFDQTRLPVEECQIRKKLREHNLWLR